MSSSRKSSSKTSSSHIVAALPHSTRGVSLSLPLLEGLCQRPESAAAIVDEALQRVQAALRIARFVGHHWQNKRQQRPKPATTAIMMIPYQQRLPTLHWLWEAMRSPSRQERHVAARLLLQGHCPCCTSSGRSKDDDDEETAHWKLQHVLLALWNQHILATSDNGGLPSNIPLEWMALLKHVVLGKTVTEERIMAFCLGGIPWICQSIWKLVTQLASSQRDASAATQIQALIGLVELCYSLLLVVFVEPAEATTQNGTPAIAAAASPATTNTSNTATTGTHSTAGATRRPSSRRLGPGSPTATTRSTPTTTTTTAAASAESVENSAAVAQRLTLRRRVLKRLFWKSMDQTAHPHHHVSSALTTTTTNNNNSTPQPLSPLACLIGAFHIWKTNTDWPYPGPTADACLTMVRQLVDPSSTAKAVSLAGLTAAVAPPTTTTTTRPTATGGTPNSTASSRPSRRRKRQRSPHSSSAGSYLLRAESSRRSRSSRSSAHPTQDEHTVDGSVTRLLSSVLGSGAAAAAAEDDEVEEALMDDVVDGQELVVDEEDDEDDSSVEHDHSENLEVDDDEIIDSDAEEAEEHDENDAEDELHEEEEHPVDANNNTHAILSSSNNNLHDDDDDDDDEDEEEEDDDADDDELDEDGDIILHDDDVARFEGLLELNEAAGGPMDIDLEDMVEDNSAANTLVMAAARQRLRGATSAASATASGGAATAAASSTSGAAASKATVDSKELAERKRLYLQACMQVLAVQHPPVMSASAALNLVSRAGSLQSSRVVSRSGSPVPHGRAHHHQHYRGIFMSPGGAAATSAGQSAAPAKCFSLVAEQSVLEAAMGIVRPPKKPVNTKMIMRRAPTQEEFFRGSLSRNPVSLSMLKPSGGGTGGSGPSSSGDVYEPTVRDLRQHIADDLQMSDSAELLELLVANKILDVNLKLRVVHQVTWKNHLMEHSHSGPSASSSSGSALASLLAGSGAGAPSFFSTGSGLSMMFSSGLGGISIGGSRGGALSRGAGGQAITADTPLAALPPLVVTYRLAGVDGEATEDTVSTLVDPDAPSDAMSPQQLEQLMEKEYGITRIVTEGRGVYVLLRSIEYHIQEVLRRIRRDDISVLMDFGKNKKSSAIGKNKSRNKFKQAPPYPGLMLLRCCAKLPSNRKKLLQARAPTILLRLLLGVLNALEDPQAKSSLALETADAGDSGSNETAEVLQELIEALASDISTTVDDTVSKPKDAVMDDSQTNETASTSDSVAAAAEGQDQDATTLSLVLSSLETISLSPPLRNIIAKLLPFLTYGQIDLSRELALNFARHIDINALVDDDKDELAEGATTVNVSNEQSKENEGTVESPSRKETTKSSALMEAFVQASIALPTNSVCSPLRSELINCGFIHRVASFVTKDVPSSPPPWSAALLPKEDANNTNTSSPNKKRQAVIKAWREFFQRQGIKMAFNMLIGLCKRHPQTQAYISQIGEEGDKLSSSGVSFLQACHWMEATSDNASNRVYVRGVGLLAETLLDDLMDDNAFVAKKVKALRRATRERKKEIAQARRSKALISMSSFGPLAGSLDGNRKIEAAIEDASARNQPAAGVRGTAASLLAPVFEFFQPSSAAEGAASAEAASSSGAPRSSPRTKKRPAPENKAKEPPTKKPAWMTEMENLEDEDGLVCSVCQEGRTLQPSELLGLYAYVKKVSLTAEQCGSRDSIDGTTLLRSLPSSLPESLVGTHAGDQWYVAGKAAGDDLRDTQRSAFSLSSSVSSSRRNSYFTTTVSAGNAIHFSCHQRARQADRNHPKAPKSEWEGAALRNSRVNCNVILPLVSSRSSDVPLVAVDSALTEYQTAVNNLTGSAAKFSMLWTVLHDVRFLLLRMAHGESLNADCGGGSLSSNAQLLIHQLMMADMFEKDAQVDSPETAQHVRNLSAGFLAACSIVHAGDYKQSASSILTRGIADAAPMACLTCILTHNARDDYGAGADSSDSKPHPKRRWIAGREQFLRGLVVCAGRRHALGIETSGCISGRGGSTSSSGPRGRSSAFPEWDSGETEDGNAANTESSSSGAKKAKKRSLKPDIDDFGTSLRPMITLYAILDQLSESFVLNMKDPDIEESAGRIVKVLEQCHKAKDIRELLETCNASFLDHDSMLEDFQKGLCCC